MNRYCQRLKILLICRIIRQWLGLLIFLYFFFFRKWFVVGTYQKFFIRGSSRGHSQWGPTTNDFMDWRTSVCICFHGRIRSVYLVTLTYPMLWVSETIPTNPCHAEPGYALLLQTVLIQISWLLQKPTDLDLHCLPLSMWIYSNNQDHAIWLAEN